MRASLLPTVAGLLILLLAACGGGDIIGLQPRIALSPSSVAFGAQLGSANPPPQSVQVSNSGSGSLGTISLGTITYLGGPTGWLGASLIGSTIDLNATTGVLPAGTYNATVPVTASGATNGQQITVSFSIIDCGAAAAVTLTPGSSSIFDPATTQGCLRLPAAGGAGAEHIVVAVSTAGQETPNGTFGTYSFNGVATAPPVLPAALIGGFGPPVTAEQFHDMLRARERALAADPASHFFAAAAPPVPALPPVLNSQRTFSVCATTACSSFVNVTATVKYVQPGGKGAVYLDDNAPAGGYTQADIDSVGQLFDNSTYGMYQIDTTAFGRESDLDNNGVVIILLTEQVNRLSTNCTQSVVLGFFFGNDLLNNAGSNHGEVFYSIVPDPFNATCTIPKSFARKTLAPTFIHEFQHMISFNQHVLVRGLLNSEETWLNEGMSHFAEELGGRQIPNSECFNQDCRAQFFEGDLQNAHDYLGDPEASYLVEPGNSFGTLAERGADWLFVRWLADQFATDTMLGTSVTRALEQSTLLGGANVSNVTGTSFSVLVPQWQLANYLEGVPTFTEPTGRFRYKSFNLPAEFAGAGLGPYPLKPDSILGGTYVKGGTLLAGSGIHFRVIQAPNANEVDLQLTTTNPGAVLPRFGVVRVR